MKKFIPFFLVVSVLSACSIKEKEPARISIPDLGEAGKSESNLAISPLVSSLAESSESACARLEEIKKQLQDSTDKSKENFSLFSALRKKSDEWHGYTDVAESPLTQFILGEKFKVDSEEDFYKKAKAEYEAGRIGGMKWLYVKMMNSMGNLRSVQYSATNDKLAETFPGLFGQTGIADASLNFSLAKRVANIPDNNEKKVAAILSSKVQLFPGDSTWATYADSSRKSLAAASIGFKSSNDKERLCSLVLFQQNFAQLLRIKGFQAPVFKKKRNTHVNALTELSASNPEFLHVEKYGSFIDTRTNETVVLENEDISQYDPSKSLMGISEKISDGTEVNQLAPLEGSLDLMEALISSFEATSPASPWIETYFLGDIQGEGKAILPVEANTLALGLLTIHFKNLAGLHIRKVNAQGKSLRDGEDAAGIILASSAVSNNQSKVRLDEVIKFTYVAAYLENALKNFIGKSPADIQKLNQGYRDETLIALFGQNMFASGDLDALVKKHLVENNVSPAEQEKVAKEQRALLEAALAKPSLIDNLRALKFPLALLLSKMGTGEAGCASELNWDLSTGRVEAISACEAKQKEALANAFRLLGRSTKSPLLMKKADQIR